MAAKKQSGLVEKPAVNKLLSQINNLDGEEGNILQCQVRTRTQNGTQSIGPRTRSKTVTPKTKIPRTQPAIKKGKMRKNPVLRSKTAVGNSKNSVSKSKSAAATSSTLKHVSPQPLLEDPPDSASQEESGGMGSIGKFSYDTYMVKKETSQLKFEEFMLAALRWGSGVTGVTVQDLQGYFTHLSYICQMAVTCTYDIKFHVDYDKAIRILAHRCGWQIFRADNSDVASVYYVRANTFPVSDPVKDEPPSDDDQPVPYTASTVKPSSHQKAPIETIVPNKELSLETMGADEKRSVITIAPNQELLIETVAPTQELMDEIFQPEVESSPTHIRVQGDNYSLSSVENDLDEVESDRDDPVLESTLTQLPVDHDYMKTEETENGSSNTKEAQSNKVKATSAIIANGEATEDHADKDHCVKELARDAQQLDKEGNKVYKCPHCNQMLRSLHTFYHHVRIHTGEKPYECSDCGIKFYMKKQLKLHMRLHTGEGFKCEHCDKMYTTRSLLKQHLPTHTGYKPHVCELCNKGHRTAHDLRQHIRGHTKEKPVSCTLCESRFTCKVNLKLHIQTIHNGERKNHQCQTCGAKFTRATAMKTHVRRIHGTIAVPVVTPAPCTICGRQLKTLYKLEKHMEAHGTEKKQKESQKLTVKKHLCPYCGKRYRYPSSLTCHIRTHTGEADPRPKSFQCEYCDKSFMYQSLLTMHTRVHTGEKPHTCAVCGKSYRLVSSYDIHMRTHTGQRPYKCPFCPKAFKARSGLSSHKFSHTKVNAHTCSTCGLSYKYPSALRQHMKTVHSDERKYVCDKCGRAFKSSSSLKSHLISHIGARPFSCRICNRSFATNRWRIQHEKNHPKHEERNKLLIVQRAIRKEELKKKRYVCTVCGQVLTQSGALSRHMKYHKRDGVDKFIFDPERTPYICNECGKGFERQRYLARHKLHKHEIQRLGEAPVHDPDKGVFVCSICRQVFNKNSYLTRHMKLHMSKEAGKAVVHDPDNGVFLCPICHEVFNKNSYLTRHMKKHLDKEPGTAPVNDSDNGVFVCSLCPQVFKKSTYLTRHMKRKHLNEGQPAATPAAAEAESAVEQIMYIQDEDHHTTGAEDGQVVYVFDDGATTHEVYLPMDESS